MLFKSTEALVCRCSFLFFLHLNRKKDQKFNTFTHKMKKKKYLVCDAHTKYMGHNVNEC